MNEKNSTVQSYYWSAQRWTVFKNNELFLNTSLKKVMFSGTVVLISITMGFLMGVLARLLWSSTFVTLKRRSPVQMGGLSN